MCWPPRPRPGTGEPPCAGHRQPSDERRARQPDRRAVDLERYLAAGQRDARGSAGAADPIGKARLDRPDRGSVLNNRAITISARWNRTYALLTPTSKRTMPRPSLPPALVRRMLRTSHDFDFLRGDIVDLLKAAMASCASRALQDLKDFSRTDGGSVGDVRPARGSGEHARYRAQRAQAQGPHRDQLRRSAQGGMRPHGWGRCSSTCWSTPDRRSAPGKVTLSTGVDRSRSGSASRIPGRGSAKKT